MRRFIQWTITIVLMLAAMVGYVVLENFLIEHRMSIGGFIIFFTIGAFYLKDIHKWIFNK